MALMKWAATAAAVAGMVALVSGCGGGGDDANGGSAEIRLLNATNGFASLDLKVDDKAVNTGVAYAAAGSFTSVAATSSATLQSGGTSIGSRSMTLTAGVKHTMIAYGRTTPLPTALLLREDQAAPTAGNSLLNVVNAAPDAGSLNVYLTAACTDSLDAASPFTVPVAPGAGSGYTTATAGTYCIRVTSASDRNDLRLSIPGVSLPSLQVANLVLSQSTGGLLVNGILLIQGGAITNYAGTSARVRILASVTGEAPVTIARGGATLLPTTKATNILDYQTVVAGNSAINVTVAGTALTAVTPDLASGGDYTIMVWGTPGAAKVSVITDDNRLPVDGQVKLRVINGLANMTGGVTLKADQTTVAGDVMPGTASNYTTRTADLGTNSVPLTLTPANTIDTIERTTLSTGVWDFILLGDGSNKAAAVYSLRKVR